MIRRKVNTSKYRSRFNKLGRTTKSVNRGFMSRRGGIRI